MVHFCFKSIRKYEVESQCKNAIIITFIFPLIFIFPEMFISSYAFVLLSSDFLFQPGRLPLTFLVENSLSINERQIFISKNCYSMLSLTNLRYWIPTDGILCTTCLIPDWATYWCNCIIKEITNLTCRSPWLINLKGNLKKPLNWSIESTEWGVTKLANQAHKNRKRAICNSHGIVIVLFRVSVLFCFGQRML